MTPESMLWLSAALGASFGAGYLFREIIAARTVSRWKARRVERGLRTGQLLRTQQLAATLSVTMMQVGRRSLDTRTEPALTIISLEAAQHPIINAEVKL